MKQIEVLVSCYYFQHRFNWMLSSLLEQKMIKVLPNIAYMKNDGNPSTRQLIDYFSPMYKKEFGTWIKGVEIIDPELFTSRGKVRDEQLQRISPFTDYVLFADCDHVYDPLFLYEFCQVADRHVNEKCMCTVARFSHDEEEKMGKLLDKLGPYPSYVPNTSSIMVNEFKLRMTTNIGAGNCQLINRKTLEGINRRYTNEGRNRDGGILKGSSRFGSDKTFRNKINNTKKLKLVNNQFHLQHLRCDADGITVNTQR